MIESRPLIDERIAGSIGILTVDAPPVNAIGAAVRAALDSGLRRMIADRRIDAVIVACAGRTFFAGADIAEFGTEPKPPTMHAVLDVIENAPKPVIAAIHGTALGGGLEFALVCHYRIAVPSAQLGLPEVHLGLLPGAGGTQRLPRIVGPELALDLIISGRRMAAGEALEIGLIDELAAEGALHDDALAFGRRIVAQGARLARVRDRQDKVEPARGRPDIFHSFRVRHREAFRGFRAPDAIVKAIEAAVALPFDAGMAREAALLAELIPSRESEAQRYAFFAERRTSKIPGIGGELAARPIATIAIAIAATGDIGDTGRNVAAIFGDAGVPAIIADPADAGALAQADFIVALPPAGIAMDRYVARIEAVCAPDAILAIALDGACSIADMAASASWPGRLIGLHLPAAGHRLIEIAPGPRTAAETIRSTMALARKIGWVPLFNGHAARSIVAQLRERLRHAAEALVRDGIAPSAIDLALRDFGFRDELFGAGGAGPGTDSDFPIARLLLPVAEEGRRLIGDGVALRASDVDMAAIFGCGWPVYSGGPMFWADKAGDGHLHNHDVGPAALDAGADLHLRQFDLSARSAAASSGSA